MKHAPVRHRIEYGAALAFQRFIRALPHEASRRVGKVIGDLLWPLLVPRRRDALANLELVYPEMPLADRRRIARQSFRHLGIMTCDTVSAQRFDEVRLCERLTIEGWSNLDAAQAAGNGVLLMSAHLGSWEIAAHPVSIYREPMHVIGRPLDNPWLNQFLGQWRTRFGNQTISKRGAARESMRILRRKGLVGILIDQRVGPAHGIVVPFLGQPALTSPLLARLAQRTGAPVVPLFGHFEPKGRYRVRFHEPIWPEGDGEDETAAFTRRALSSVEEQIHRDPGTWLWLHKRWKMPPAAGT